MSDLLTFEQLIDLDNQRKRLAIKLANALAARYEIGTPVVVLRGEREFRGKVVGEPNHWCAPTDLLIESHTGWRFRANFRNVEEQ